MRPHPVVSPSYSTSRLSSLVGLNDGFTPGPHGSGVLFPTATPSASAGRLPSWVHGAIHPRPVRRTRSQGAQGPRKSSASPDL